MNTEQSVSTDDNVVVRLENIGMRFGSVTALQDISGVMVRGRITGLLGPDAAGKTTLARILAGLMAPTSGQVRVLGKDPLTLSQDACIGYMPQRFGLYEDLSVQDNLKLHAALKGLEGEERDSVFYSVLRFTNLGEFTDRLAGKLSGGMKQKLGIACALLGSPQLLILDEPGVGVDPLSRRDLWAMVCHLAQEGMSILWSTAYLDEAERCEDIIVLDEGRLLFSGNPHELSGRAKGKVFRLLPPPSRARATLMDWIVTPGVADALIQGKYVRIVLGDTGKDLASRLQQEGEPVTPRLEDAYMRELGGIRQEASPFAQAGMCEQDEKIRIEARGLTKKFGTFVAASDISFSVQSGRIFGLLGPNGAGKSTTFRMLCGLSAPTSGECFVNGINLIQAGGMARAHLGYMAQKFSLYTDISVRENILFFGKIYGLRGKQLVQRMEELASAMELDSFLNTATGLLPLGHKQRLSLVCATLHNPPVLFLDEPTSGVDARTRRDFWKHIVAMTQTGTTVLVTTHFMEEAEYCDAIALVYRGRIISMGSPDALKAAEAQGEVEDPTIEEAFISCIQRYDSEQH